MTPVEDKTVMLLGYSIPQIKVHYGGFGLAIYTILNEIK